ncbi:hypothetical protein AAMO2058_001447800 [Amorphochlora amoebiformis]
MYRLPRLWKRAVVPMRKMATRSYEDPLLLHTLLTKPQTRISRGQMLSLLRDLKEEDGGEAVEKLRTLCSLYLQMNLEEKANALVHFCLRFGSEIPGNANAFSGIPGDPEIGFHGEKSPKVCRNDSKFLSVISRMIEMKGGLDFLVNVRGDILTIQRAAQYQLEESKNETEKKNGTIFRNALLSKLSTYLHSLFRQRFREDILEIRRISWESPEDLLRDITEFEAVHPVENRQDLKNRLGAGRRCFGLFHPKMEQKPLAFVHAALTHGYPPGDIRRIIGKTAEYLNSDTKATHIAFYSISSTQQGLSGVEIGAFLLKKAIPQVRLDIPSVSCFLTLSPVPQLRSWILRELTNGSSFLNSSEESQLITLLPPHLPSDTLSTSSLLANLLSVEAMNWWALGESKQASQAREVLEPVLLRLAARYFLLEKRPNRPDKVPKNSTYLYIS